MKDKYIDEERDDSILPAAEDQELMSVHEKKTSITRSEYNMTRQ